MTKKKRGQSDFVRCPYCGKGYRLAEYNETVILKILRSGPKNWSDLKKNMTIGTATLSRRLKHLIKLGKVKRVVISGFPPRTLYELIDNR